MDGVTEIQAAACGDVIDNSLALSANELFSRRELNCTSSMIINIINIRIQILVKLNMRLSSRRLLRNALEEYMDESQGRPSKAKIGKVVRDGACNHRDY